MTGHRAILKELLQTEKLTLPAIAQKMGWESPRSVAHKLAGRRDWKAGELEKMCEIAGITLIQLAQQADDLVLAKHKESLDAAAIVDRLPPEKRPLALDMLKAIEGG